MDPQSSQSVPQEVQTPAAPRSPSKLPIVLGVCLLILAIAGGSYYMGKQSEKTSIRQPTPTQPSISPTITLPDEITNWTIYTSKDKAFSFKYPSMWYVEQHPAFPNTTEFFLQGTKAIHGEGDQAGNEVFSIEYSDRTETLIAIKEKYYRDANNITLAGKDAFITSFGLIYTKPSANKNLSIMTGKTYKKIVDGVLSTFKFTN